MALPAPGNPLSANMINVEGNRSGTALAPLGGQTGTAAAGSLVKLFENASPSGVNQNSPYNYSDFYGKSFGTARLCQNKRTCQSQPMILAKMT